MLTATFLHHSLLLQRLRFVDRLELDLVLGAAWRNRQAPRALALLVGQLLAGHHIDDVAAKVNHLFHHKTAGHTSYIFQPYTFPTLCTRSHHPVRRRPFHRTPRCSATNGRPTRATRRHI